MENHALWFYTQLVRWGQITHDKASREDREGDL